MKPTLLEILRKYTTFSAVLYGLFVSFFVGFIGLEYDRPVGFFFGALAGQAFVWYGFGWLATRVSSPDAAHLCAECRRIATLPLAEVRACAEQMIHDPEKINCVEDHAASYANEENLPPLVREFFQRYRRVQFTRGNGTLDRDMIAASEAIEGGWIIGASTSVELTVLPDSDIVYEIDVEDEDPVQYPTIYHWLLAEAFVLDEYAPPEPAPTGIDE